MDYLEFIKPELQLLILVGYFIGMALKNSEKIQDWTIPFIIGGVNIVLSVVYLFSVSSTLDSRNIATLVFTGIVQGVLTAAGAVFVNQLKKQATVGRAEDTATIKHTKII